MALGEERDLVPLGAGFDIVKRGYSRMQVEEHLEQLDGQLKILAADRNAAAAQANELTAQLEVARTTIDDLKSQVERLAQPPTTMAGLSERLQRMLRLTQEECEEIRAKAHADADHTRAKAEAEADELRGKYETQLKELDERRIAMEAEHQEVLTSARAQADEIIATAKSASEAADLAAQTRRTQVEEDFEIAMASRRTESMRALAEQEATSKSEAERRVREATEEANRRRHDAITESTARLQEATDEANRRVREATDEANRRINHAAARVSALRKLRGKLAEQLTSARELVADAHAYLENAVPAFEPLPDELEEAADAGASPTPPAGPSNAGAAQHDPAGSAQHGDGKPAQHDPTSGPTQHGPGNSGPAQHGPGRTGQAQQGQARPADVQPTPGKPAAVPQSAEAAKPSPTKRFPARSAQAGSGNRLPGPPREKWETGGAPEDVPIPPEVAAAKTKRIASAPRRK